MYDIISASRREDIITNINRYKELQNIMSTGTYQINNKFMKKMGKFDVGNVGALCLWSKNYQNFLLDPGVLETFNLYFNFTITGYSKVIEPGVVDWKSALVQAEAIATKYGANKINWRFDPICFLEGFGVTQYDNTESGTYGRFVAIAKHMQHIGVKRCTISFLSEYNIVLDRIDNTGFKVIPKSIQDKKRIADNIATLAKDFGIEVYSCSSPLLESELIKKSSCIDGKLLGDLFGLSFTSSKDKSQRVECGCTKSRDIGVYVPCPSKCVYCYSQSS